MVETPKRVDVRYGEFACSIVGFDDPVQPLRQVLRTIQRVVEETPEFSRAVIQFDSELIESLLAQVTRRAGAEPGSVAVVPGLVIVHGAGAAADGLLSSLVDPALRAPKTGPDLAPDGVTGVTAPPAPPAMAAPDPFAPTADPAVPLDPTARADTPTEAMAPPPAAPLDPAWADTPIEAMAPPPAAPLDPAWADTPTEAMAPLPAAPLAAPDGWIDANLAPAAMDEAAPAPDDVSVAIDSAAATHGWAETDDGDGAAAPDPDAGRDADASAPDAAVSGAEDAYFPWDDVAQSGPVAAGPEQPPAAWDLPGGEDAGIAEPMAQAWSDLPPGDPMGDAMVDSMDDLPDPRAEARIDPAPDAADVAVAPPARALPDPSTVAAPTPDASAHQGVAAPTPDAPAHQGVAAPTPEAPAREAAAPPPWDIAEIAAPPPAPVGPTAFPAQPWRALVERDQPGTALRDLATRFVPEVEAPPPPRQVPTPVAAVVTATVGAAGGTVFTATARGSGPVRLNIFDVPRGAPDQPRAIVNIFADPNELWGDSADPAEPAPQNLMAPVADRADPMVAPPAPDRMAALSDPAEALADPAAPVAQDLMAPLAAPTPPEPEPDLQIAPTEIADWDQDLDAEIYGQPMVGAGSDSDWATATRLDSGPGPMVDLPMQAPDPDDFAAMPAALVETIAPDPAAVMAGLTQTPLLQSMDGAAEPPAPDDWAAATATPEPGRFDALLSRLNTRPLVGVPDTPALATATDDDDDGATASAADLAAAAGARSVPDLLAAAAAWLTLVEDQPRFTRRDVMAVFETIPGDHPKTLEARIKGYGKLVRGGQLVLVDDGLFALAQSERDRYADMME